MKTTYSIITVCLNNLQGLKKTYTSIAEQICQDFEWIVVDGGSNDGTLEFLQSTKNISSYISEPDKGIYDAMNKGISLSQGRYFLFLNAGDYLYDKNILEHIRNELIGDLVIGWVERVKFDGNRAIHKLKRVDDQDLRKKFLFLNAIPHQAAFISGRLFEQYGMYDSAYKICADRVFFIKAILGGASIKFIKEIICVVPMDGISAQLQHRINYEIELQRLRKENFSLRYRMLRFIVDMIERSFARK